MKRHELQRLIEAWDLVGEICVSPMPVKEIRARLCFLTEISCSDFEVGSFEKIGDVFPKAESLGIEVGINFMEYGGILFQGRSNEMPGKRKLIHLRTQKRIKISDVLRFLEIYGYQAATLEELIVFAVLLNKSKVYKVIALGDKKNFGDDVLVPLIRVDPARGRMVLDITTFDIEGEMIKIPEGAGILAYTE